MESESDARHTAMWRNFLAPPNTVRVAISGREKTTALVRPIPFDVRTTPKTDTARYVVVVVVVTLKPTKIGNEPKDRYGSHRRPPASLILLKAFIGSYTSSNE